MATFLAPTPLILLAQVGDRRALEDLFRGIQKPLYDYLVGLVGNAHVAEDLLQDVFVLVWRKLPWLRDPALFRPWVYRIASREGFRRLKQERSWWRMLGWSELETVAEEVNPEPALSEWVDQLSQHLTDLSPACRAVLVLHYQQALTLEEVAAVLELPVGTVKSRLAYGLAVLRQKFARGGNTDERQQAQ